MTMEGGNPMRLCIWATCRSNINALLKTFCNVSQNCKVINKSYALPYFYGEERYENRVERDVIPNATYMDVKKYLEQDFEGQDVVVKNVAFNLRGRTHNLDVIPEGYKHLLLIRDPVRVITSLHTGPGFCNPDRCSDGFDAFDAQEARYNEISELFYTLERETGQTPVLIDTDEFLKNPEPMLKKVCQLLEIPFCDEMINWRPETQDLLDNMVHLAEHTKEMFNRYASKDYSGLRPREPRPLTVDVATLPQEVKDAIEEAIPLYERLYEFRVRVQ